MPESSVVVSTVLPLLVCLALVALVAMMVFLSKYLVERYKDSRWGLFLKKVDALLDSVVQRIEVELKPIAVTALADGIITPEEAKILRDSAVKMALSTGATWLRKEADSFGYVGQMLTEWLLGRVEQRVAVMPQKLLAAQAASGSVVAIQGGAPVPSKAPAQS